MMQNRRILIVDDEPAFIRLLKLNLERTGRYVVREVNDATKALEAAVDFRPDLILLDLIMPRLHGSEVAYSVRTSAVLSKTPIVFLTASVCKSEVSPNPQIAGCMVVAKPASMTEVIDAIENNLLPIPPAPEAEAGNWLDRVRRMGRTLIQTSRRNSSGLPTPPAGNGFKPSAD